LGDRCVARYRRRDIHSTRRGCGLLKYGQLVDRNHMPARLEGCVQLAAKPYEGGRNRSHHTILRMARDPFGAPGAHWRIGGMTTNRQGRLIDLSWELTSSACAWRRAAVVLRVASLKHLTARYFPALRPGSVARRTLAPGATGSNASS